MADKGFSRRLNVACDGHPHIPAYGQGRQTWVKEHLEVSHEAVRKWFTGLSRPRPDKMRQLARALEVDEAWLALGIEPDMTPADKRVRNMQAEGAVNATVGLFQLNGAVCAFPDEKDPRAAYVDFYCILRGAQHSFHVSLAKQVSEGQYKFVLPKEYDLCTPLGLIHAFPLRVHGLRMTTDLLNKHATRRGGYYEVMVNKRDSEYYTGQDVWPRLHNLNSF